MKVKLISLTQGTDEFEGKTAEDIIVYAARVSSNRDDKFESPDKLLSYCIRNKHWSIFETAYVTFEIETSRAMGRQLLRHRSATFQEFSQRYSDVLGFEPIELRRQGKTNRQSSEEVFNPDLAQHPDEEGMFADKIINDLLFHIDMTYQSLLDAGVAKETARMILPECTNTKMYMTNNLRNWIHFIEVREDEHAQKEIRELATEIKTQLKYKFPIIAKALNW